MLTKVTAPFLIISIAIILAPYFFTKALRAVKNRSVSEKGFRQALNLDSIFIRENR